MNFADIDVNSAYLCPHFAVQDKPAERIVDLDVCSAYLNETPDFSGGIKRGELNVIGSGRIAMSGKSNFVVQHIALMSHSERMDYFKALAKQYEYDVESHDMENTRSVQSLPGGRTRQEDLEYTQTFNDLIKRFKKASQ